MKNGARFVMLSTACSSWCKTHILQSTKHVFITRVYHCFCLCDYKTFLMSCHRFACICTETPLTLIRCVKPEMDRRRPKRLKTRRVRLDELPWHVMSTDGLITWPLTPPTAGTLLAQSVYPALVGYDVSYDDATAVLLARTWRRLSRLTVTGQG